MSDLRWVGEVREDAPDVGLERKRAEHRGAWCDVCKYPVVGVAGQGRMHITPGHPEGLDPELDKSDHEITIREWFATPTDVPDPPPVQMISSTDQWDADFAVGQAFIQGMVFQLGLPMGDYANFIRAFGEFYANRFQGTERSLPEWYRFFRGRDDS